MTPFKIGVFEFASKGAAQAELSRVLKEWRPGVTIEGTDAALLFEALAQHPWKKSINGKSFVKSFTVEINPTYKSLYLMAHRADGTTAAFPTKRFFEDRNPNKREIFVTKCRKAVAKQIIQFKKDKFDGSGTLRSAIEVRCEITGEWIGWNDCHIDHIYPFECMIRDWLAQGNDFSRDSVTRFARWHNDAAILRCVSTKANLTRKDDNCE